MSTEMHLQKLSIINFKNYEDSTLQFTEKINCFIGDNGAGKTNLLDAIHYLSFCKSYFNPVDTQNIRHNETFFSIHGSFLKNGDNPDIISCIQKTDQRKIFRINQKEYERLADHIGLFPLVMVSPYDRDLINEGSEVRRRYLDGVISQFDRSYLDDLISYNKALAQRNALLKHFSESRTFNAVALEIWDAQLVDYGQKIHEKRYAFLHNFIPVFRKYFEFISEGKETVDIKYLSQLFDRKLDELLAVNVEKDRMARYTTQGIHKDDLEFMISGFPLKKFGSQGQQKSFVVAIKLAQFDYTRDIKGFKPILLFDDIFDKLDDKRVHQIIRLVSENSFGQVFITDTQRSRIEKLFEEVAIDHRIFEISAGQVNLL
ncbi:MAG: DNA replication/repair protein RecF [Bacteroidales bacterium]|nr:DNA replication/repair protein RecF [Bacteroidales bacterium]